MNHPAPLTENGTELVLGDLASDGRFWATVAVAAAATAPWLFAVAIVYLRRRPSEPQPGPPTLDLGPEPPAIANFLVHHFRVTHDAVPATLLDLAARGVVEIEERGPGSYVCRLHETGDEPLSAYERRIVELLRGRASGGIVPAQALTTGPAKEASRWWNDFRREVVADSQRRGLSLDILDGRTFKRLSLAALAPAAIVWLLFDFTAGAAYWGVAAVLLGVIKTWHTQRDTPSGLEAASRWLGVRAKLQEDEAFPEIPPIAVALWKRHLAYGAAFGVAPGAVRPIPMGAESDTRAWSSYGGPWRAVRIKYPHLLPPGWGLHPLIAMFRAVIAAAVSVFVLSVVAPTVFDVAPNAGGLELLIGALLVGVPAAVVTAAGLAILQSLADLWSTRDVTGQILRLRVFSERDEEKRHYVAIDDGTSSPTIRAFRVKPELYTPLEQGEVVTATLTPNLRYVRAIRPAASETGTEAATARVPASS